MIVYDDERDLVRPATIDRLEAIPADPTQVRLLAVERERADVAEAKAARYAWIIRQYAEADRVRCGWCGARPADPVEIDGIRYCNHKDSPSPTCYELAVQRKGHLAAMSEYDEGEPINPVGIR